MNTDARATARARLAAMTLAVAGLLGGCGSHAAAPPAADRPHNPTLTAAQRQHITLDTVVFAPFHKAIGATGVVDFDNDQATRVLAPFSGPVAQLLVSAGQHVAKGQPLARVDSPDFAAAVGAYGKALVAARNARRLAEADRDLGEHEGLPRRELEQAQTDAASADADRAAALQALLALGADAPTIREIEAGRTGSRIPAVIRAPVAGTVAEKLITPGQLLQAGDTACFTVADLSRMWVIAQVAPAELAGVAEGDAASIDAGGIGTLQGRVDNIGTVVDPDTRAVPVRVVVDNAAGRLRKQMYVHVRIHSRRAERGLLVPVSAILRDEQNLPFVYVAQPDGSFARHGVALGYRAGDRYQVSEGLRAGDRVVVQGGLFVQFMQNQ
ncbi:MAG TPA: efflux RND transporter periplasmic adaptor subunit [Frateuria sp.]|uniref:efflux RND transporter periplasmic adaptor subunit n=1 Tax=Frateuria sp. TaxID=2211372 RepID=UPI002D807846|nr:efflux RND transporter periplasmic adaptor subunit [Frateuria sp.]HET6805816.1 efflux RND transporter periplasmic adaptor subunit [Frateuria sp.]